MDIKVGEKLKLIIECYGDVSESVPNYEMSVDFGDFEITPNERDDVRGTFENVFDQLGFIYNGASFHFEDECSECYTGLIDGKCKTCDERYDNYQKYAEKMQPLYDWIRYNDEKIATLQAEEE